MTDNNEDHLTPSGLKSSSEYYDLIADAPDFGLWQLTVRDAAALVVLDIWFAGKISIEFPEAELYDWRDPGLRQALSKHFIDYEKRLTTAIDGGSLKTTKIRRNLNEELDIDKTLVNQNDLRLWLDERGHICESSFEEYLGEENDLYNSVVIEIYTHRMMLNSPELLPKNMSKANLNPESAGINELRLAVKELTNDNIDLYTNTKQLEKELRERRENHPKKTERPLSTRARRTLLTIIAALCNQAGINYKDRGAAKRISELTEEIGAAVTDETIRKIISEIDDALEFRMK